jgi:hypothetical protein
VHAPDLEATAGHPRNERGEKAYFLQPRYQEVRDYISNLEETKIVNFKFQKHTFNKVTHTDESSS